MALLAADIKRVKSLGQKKFRKDSRLFVTEGMKSVEELLQSKYAVEQIYCTEDLPSISSNLPFELIKQKELERMSSLKTANKILAVARLPEVNPINFDAKLILVLDGIRDPGNLGTIIRTAKWFGVNEIVCSSDCVDAYSPKVVQSTMGALFHVNVCYANLEEAVAELATKKYAIVGSVMDGKPLGQFTPSEKTALVIGSESHGISEPILSLCNDRLTIPNLEEDRKIESLNAAIATSILLSGLTK
ncbi:MAG: TrmH family RNA methyltransferase [Flavobacteriales bacterium]